MGDSWCTALAGGAVFCLVFAGSYMAFALLARGRTGDRPLWTTRANESERQDAAPHATGSPGPDRLRTDAGQPTRRRDA